MSCLQEQYHCPGELREIPLHKDTPDKREGRRWAGRLSPIQQQATDCTFAHTMRSSWLLCPSQQCLALLLHTLQLPDATDLRNCLHH